MTDAGGRHTVKAKEFFELFWDSESARYVTGRGTTFFSDSMRKAVVCLYSYAIITERFSVVSLQPHHCMKEGKDPTLNLSSLSDQVW